LAAWGGLLLGAPGAVLWGCQYNVRDVGFVDLENEPYVCYALVNPDTPAAWTSNLAQTASSLFTDTNLRFELLGGDDAAMPPALKELDRAERRQRPFAVLVSPDGPVLPVSFGEAARPSAPPDPVLEGLVTSPLREQIVRQACESYAVVLLLEGTEPAQNARARQAIQSAIDQTAGQLKSLPKAIAQPPSLVVLDQAAAPREQVLLWSLRADGDKARETRAAVIYGKARWIGPLMRGEEISDGNLTRIMSIIGADCECGLDLSWTRGTRLPVRWGEAVRRQAAKSLGFDPESPMVQAEVGRILEKSHVRPARQAQGAVAPGEPVPAPSERAATPGPVRTNTAPTPRAPTGATLAEGQIDTRNASVRRLLVFAGVAGALILGVGLLILVRRGGKNG
jgi:hypothetical protein